jgi:purine nucleosidase
MTTHNLILDGDFGVDDSLALLYLAGQPDVTILGIGTVHGNAPAALAARNALAVLEVAGLTDVPVAVGAERPLAQPVTISAMVHGADGLGGRAPAAVVGEPVGTSAAEQLLTIVRAQPGACTIVATGPLTNLALALLLEPRLPQLVEKVVLMGGTVNHPGNVGPLAEANIAHDPEAADLVFAAPWPVTQVGLDVTMTTWLDDDDLERITADRSDRGRFAWSIMQHYLDFYDERHGRRSCPLHDPSAAYIALHPELASYLRAPVSVELRSPRNRGMLIVERREYVAAETPLVNLVMDVDRRRLIDGFLDGLLSPDRT